MICIAREKLAEENLEIGKRKDVIIGLYSLGCLAIGRKEEKRSEGLLGDSPGLSYRSREMREIPPHHETKCIKILFSLGRSSHITDDCSK